VYFWRQDLLAASIFLIKLLEMVESSQRHPEFIAPKQTCSITFTINYKTEYGQAISIVGDHPKLGSWTDVTIGCMKWHTGDVWKLTVSGLDSASHFQYKYVLIDTNKKEAIRWE
jgi:alpha-amylase